MGDHFLKKVLSAKLSAATVEQLARYRIGRIQQVQREWHQRRGWRGRSLLTYLVLNEDAEFACAIENKLSSQASTANS